MLQDTQNIDLYII